MKKSFCLALALITGVALSTTAVAQGKSPAKEKEKTQAHATSPATHANTTAHTSSKHVTTHGKSVAHRPTSPKHASTTHVHTTTAKTPPARSNKGGEVRGKARAQEVHAMNQDKKAAQKSKVAAPAATAHKKGKGPKK